ncbi:hypothetical protein niasHT_036941 [Heterodera trifolii]|uniref:Uncharacterized protein n=1 Tax=Heterodera trifolii TaxID=157864 RepID=A0ABD2IFE1_9BILA
MNCLSKISEFLFDSRIRKVYQNRFEALFIYWPEPILENEQELMKEYGLKRGGEGTKKQQKTDKVTKGKKQMEEWTKRQQKTDQGTKEMEKMKHSIFKEKRSLREKFDEIMENMEQIAEALTSINRLY